MVYPQPVVCVFLKYPPEEQTFFRIRDLSEAFLNKVDKLTTVLAASPATNTSPVAIQAVQDLREAAATRCLELSGAIFGAHQFASTYLYFVQNLSPLEVSDETFVDIRRIYVEASVEMEKIETARKAMVQFKQDVTDTVARIQVAVEEGNDSNDVFTLENGQTVAELFQAIDECNSLLQQVNDYHTDMKIQTEPGKEQEIKSCMPSEGEITIMRERWTDYSNNVKEVNSSFGTVMQKLLSGEGIKRPDSSHNNRQNSDAAMPPASASNPAEQVNEQNLILGMGVPGPSHAEPKVPFWRLCLRYIYSCLTLKCFR